MIKRLALVILMDFIVLAVVTSVIIPYAQITRECSERLYWAGIANSIYLVFFVVRNMVVCTSSYFTKSPLTTSTLARLGFICIDCAAYSSVVIWSTF